MELTDLTPEQAMAEAQRRWGDQAMIASHRRQGMSIGNVWVGYLGRDGRSHHVASGADWIAALRWADSTQEHLCHPVTLTWVSVDIRLPLKLQVRCWLCERDFERPYPATRPLPPDAERRAAQHEARLVDELRKLSWCPHVAGPVAVSRSRLRGQGQIEHLAAGEWPPRPADWACRIPPKHRIKETL